MKCLTFLVAFVMLSTQLLAQQNHFIYIQTENKQPFYVRMNSKVLSSSTSGYMVISKLQDGVYDLYIGFPKNEWPQQKINVTIRNNDAGYILKNFESKGWGLFNMQTMDVIMSADSQKRSEQAVSSQPDGFADVLADVVNNPSIKQKPVIKEPEKVKTVVDEQKSVTEKQEMPAEVKIEKPVTEGIKPATKVFSVLEAGGRSLVYTDTYGGKIDTVRIFIPYTEPQNEKAGAAPGNTTKNDVPLVKEETVKPAAENKELKVEDKKPVQVEMANPSGVKADTVLSEPLIEKKSVPVKEKEVITETPVIKEVVMINSDCKSIATEDDFLKLRKKMAAQKTDENMIVVAKRSFMAKCYTTEQVKNLSSLFLKDEGCYNFFDAAYPHVNDSQNFAGLISRLTEEYYINRFKAMIRH